MFRTGKFVLMTALTLTLAATTVVAFAQDAPGQAQPGGRQGRQGQRGGRGRVSVATVPVAALDSALKLTGEQKTKIKAIHDKLAEEMKGARPAPGSPPDPAAMQKLRDLNQQAVKDIEAILTDDQKAKLPDTIKELGALRNAGIPLEVVGDLKLTADQKTKIAAIAKEAQDKVSNLTPEERRAKMRETMQESRDKTMALLTDAQKKVITKFNDDAKKKQEQGNN